MALTASENLFHCNERGKDGFLDRCRVCMCVKKDMICVITSVVTRTVDELEFCTGIRITKGDGLPTKICDQCLSTLDIAYKFKKDCLLSDKKFQDLLAKGINDIIKKEEMVKVKDVFYEEPVVTQQEIKLECDDYDNDDEPFDSGGEDFAIPPSLRSKIKSPINANYLNNITHITATKPSKKNYNNCRNKAGNKTTQEKKSVISEKMTHSQNAADLVKRKELAKLTCLECNTIFDSKILLAKHKRELHKLECICEICGKRFKYRSSHYTHLKSHFLPSHKCQFCEYTTCHKTDLSKHMRVHSEVKNYVCEYCTRAFRFTSNLHDHIRRSHLGAGGGSARNHQCPRCARQFYDAYKMRRHLDAHDKIKRHECSVCHSQFSRRCHWKRHLQKVHSITIPRMRPGRQKTNFINPTKSIANPGETKPSESKLPVNELKM